MRLFIAIDLPDSVKEYLRKLQNALPEAKMSKTHDFHLTLKFLGSCDSNLKKKIEETLKGVNFQPFEAKLTEIGVFGGRNPRVIWIGIQVPEWLSETVAEIEKRISKMGFLPAGRQTKKENRFVPHITLARIKFIQDSKKFLEELKKNKIEQLKFPVEKFYLFESQLSPKGAVHTKLAAFPK